MPEHVFTAHAKDMLKERGILEEWVLQAIQDADQKKLGNDGNVHYFKLLPERENHILHVVVNETAKTSRIVTLFLDRRERKAK
jgi:hypothetical protein